MQVLQQVLFILVAAAAIVFFIRNCAIIRRNILLGQEVQLIDNPAARWRKVLLFAVGQKRMFQKPVVGVMHLLIYAGFIIINIEILEIMLDGMLGTHRLFAPVFGVAYTFLINFFELLAIAVLVACVVFLVRRNVIKIDRLNRKELVGFPKTDANAILVTEIILMSLFLTMNAADRALQLQQYGHYSDIGSFWFSGLLSQLFAGLSTSTLVAIERTCWWLHIVGILAFMNYLPYSKHLHIILGFPNTYYSSLAPQGYMPNMPDIQNEVLYAMQPEMAPQGEPATLKFGARDVPDLTWKNLMDAYSCTECGRCTEACPANITGKKLNPRKIMMDTRDRMEEIGKNITTNKEFVDDNKTLLHDYITDEELRACTTCQACVQACPVSISPLDIIYRLRRHLIMEETNAPQEWNGMFSNIENNFAPWKFSPSDRDNWAKEMS